MKKMRSLVVSTGLTFFLMILLSVSFSSAASDFNVGIIQISEHPSLDNAREGFMDVFEENGYVEGEEIDYDYQNAQGDMSTANTIAQKFGTSNLDLILAIATPTAQAVANVVKDTPILITAVTDPVAAGLVDSLEEPGNNVTGTTDMTPVTQQLELFKSFQPDAEKIGVIYNAGETNSVVQVEMAREAADKLGYEIVEATADSSSGVYQAAQSLVGKVDGIYVPTDNTVVSSIESVIMVAEDNKLPLIVGEDNSVERGALATRGLNYYKLGRQTGEMALRILEDDQDPATMPIESLEKTELVINRTAADNMGIDIPKELKQNATIID